jgi:hypothetical protein
MIKIGFDQNLVARSQDSEIAGIDSWSSNENYPIAAFPGDLNRWRNNDFGLRLPPVIDFPGGMIAVNGDLESALPNLTLNIFDFSCDRVIVIAQNQITYYTLSFTHLKKPLRSSHPIEQKNHLLKS